jgi:Family of unknown function (DUF6084)
MVDLDFTPEGAEIEPYAAAPTLFFKVRVTNQTPDVAVQNVSLLCQVRIEATRRSYAAADHERLVELFGEMHRWSETLRSLLWTHTSVQVPAFETDRVVNLPIECCYDFNVAATKYFYGLEGGEVPLALLFSGTVFYRDAEAGSLQMDQISWSKEANYRLPVRLWQDMMDQYYPNSAWLRLDRDVFDEIYQYKRQQGFTTWEQTLHSLLKKQRENAL